MISNSATRKRREIVHSPPPLTAGISLEAIHRRTVRVLHTESVGDLTHGAFRRQIPHQIGGSKRESPYTADLEGVIVSRSDPTANRELGDTEPPGPLFHRFDQARGRRFRARKISKVPR